MTLEASRETPGGFPVLYFHQGILPNDEHFEYIIDLQKTDYDVVKVVNPSPRIPSPTQHNPGMWFVCVVKTSPLPQEGFLFRWQSY